MRLYVEPMDEVVVEVDQHGRIRYETRPEEGWSVPTLQERRAIIYAAQREVSDLTELLDILERQG